MLRSWHQTCWLQSYWTATDGLPMLVIMREVNTRNVPMVCRCSPQTLSPMIFFRWKSVKVIYVRLWNILFPKCGLVLRKPKYLCTSTGFSTASVVNDSPNQCCSRHNTNLLGGGGVVFKCITEMCYASKQKSIAHKPS